MAWVNTFCDAASRFTAAHAAIRGRKGVGMPTESVEGESIEVDLPDLNKLYGDTPGDD